MTLSSYMDINKESFERIAKALNTKPEKIVAWKEGLSTPSRLEAVLLYHYTSGKVKLKDWGY